MGNAGEDQRYYDDVDAQHLTRLKISDREPGANAASTETVLVI
jgi:hypothetical protein